ncbi:MAG TPA: RnfABCDGE type electron transport complex subunit D [Bacillota bacterium]|nr:RnfABCDGE type electron transport complex subunit D [Bacillota bacterium]HPL53863.1 RnfABCDGE type electron transport complex subunit D [Bacillota bacterium]
MENTKFLVSSSPHIRSGETTQRIMLDVIIALMPALFAGVFNFGFGVLTLTITAVIFSVAAEAAMQKILGKPITVNDLSAVVTGILIAFNVPATLPLWIIAVGSVFAIVIAKHCFGGLGYNFINPALAGRAMLLASWPVRMTNWVAPGVDAVSSATPLAIYKWGFQEASAAGQAIPSLWNLFIGNIGGCIGETSALALLIGGAYLLYRKVINPRIPVAYIATVAVFSFLFGGFDPFSMIYHILAGGLFLGAIFMATDYSTSPISEKGQIIFGVGCGFLTSVIRFFGGYPEGVSYSILLMNVATPLIDKYTMPRKFGEVKKSA